MKAIASEEDIKAELKRYHQEFCARRERYEELKETTAAAKAEMKHSLHRMLAFNDAVCKGLPLFDQEDTDE